jgi:two-component sensor histidine kinase
MDGALAWLFGSAGSTPQGTQLLRRPDLLALHAGSDALIALSYFAIPAVIWWYMRRRPDLAPEHRRVGVLFALFITACGLAHLMAIVTVWKPFYGLEGLVKAWCAAISVLTAASLPFLAPKLLALRSPKELEAEVDAHRRTMGALEDAHRLLERKLADRDEDLSIANKRFMKALRGSGVSMIEQDAELRYTWAFNYRYLSDDSEVIGRTEFDLMEHGNARALRAIKNEVLASGELREFEFAIDAGGEQRWIHLRIQPAVLRGGGQGIIGLSMDITELKRHQVHLEVVMRELNHRSKNLLTIVQSIARQTAVGLAVPDAFLSRLSDRLGALAAAHDVLVAGDWRGADLKAVVESQLRHQIDGMGGRIRLSGERFELPPAMAHYLGLAIHELGANAVKYGALAGEKGVVEIDWSAEALAEGGRRFRLAWREQGGPSVSPPSRRGFGRTILEVLTPRALAGTAALSFDPGGVAWTLEAPLDSAS